MNNYFLLVIGILLLQSCNKQPDFKYFGQTPPGDTPELFSPGIISTDSLNEAMITFSPDGKECYYTVSENPWNDVNIMQLVYDDSAWTNPSKALFINGMGMSPSISANGNEFYYIGAYKNSVGVNQSVRTADGSWSTPVQMDSTINSGFAEYSCHRSSLGTMFVCSWRAGGVGGCDGWQIPFKNGHYQKAENMGALNSKVGDCLWAPGPNEEFLIYQTRRPAISNQGGFYETDLFITFAMPDGSWSVPQNLGPEINSSATDGFAWVTHDGKYLFFSSDRNGQYDIYWVSLDAVIKNTPRISFADVKPSADDYAFFQIYDPNKTIIAFDLSVSGNVKLEICNLERESMETIFDDYKPAGENLFNWKGEGYEKGEYLCKMQVSDNKSDKVILESTIQVLLR